jgi:hypothetical protein
MTPSTSKHVTWTGQIFSKRKVHRTLVFISLRVDGGRSFERVVEGMVQSAHAADPQLVSDISHDWKIGDIVQIHGYIENVPAVGLKPAAVAPDTSAQHAGVDIAVPAKKTKIFVVCRWARRLHEWRQSEDGAKNIPLRPWDCQSTLSANATFAVEEKSRMDAALAATPGLPRSEVGAAKRDDDMVAVPAKRPRVASAVSHATDDALDEARGPPCWFFGVPLHRVCRHFLNNGVCLRADGACPWVHYETSRHAEIVARERALLSPEDRDRIVDAALAPRTRKPVYVPHHISKSVDSHAAAGSASSSTFASDAQPGSESETGHEQKTAGQARIDSEEPSAPDKSIIIKLTGRLRNLASERDGAGALEVVPTFGEMRGAWGQWRAQAKALGTLHLLGDTTGTVPPRVVSSDGGHDVQFHAGRAHAFVEWLVQTFPPSLLQKGVLDVAGGRGDVSRLLALLHNVKCTVVDARDPPKPNKRHERQFKTRPGAPPPVQIKAWFGPDWWSSEEGKTLTASIGLVVGFHPDQATEPIVDFALSQGVPFAVVPCCVFGRDFPHRRLRQHPLHQTKQPALAQDGRGFEVNSYEEFVGFLLEKDGDIAAAQTSDAGAELNGSAGRFAPGMASVGKDSNIQLAFLPYHGRNAVLYRLT